MLVVLALLVHVQRTVRLRPLTVQPKMSIHLYESDDIQPADGYLYLQPYGYSPQGEL